jgi:sodium pump decarboxylase gamma subunit
MSKLLFGLSVMLIGILVVFCGLVLLIGCIKLISFFSRKKDKSVQPADDAVAEAIPEIPEAPVAEALPQGLAPETLAAITAAVAAVWQGDTGFVVRRVRRVHNAAAWNLAGREDQVYSRM